MTKTITDLSDVSVDDLDSIQGTRLLLHVDQGSARVAEWTTKNHGHVKRLLQANYQQIPDAISHEWLDGNRLRTRQINQARIRHPVTGAQVWFNQAHLFHVSNLDEELQMNLLTTVDETDLPRNTYYEDGAPIATSDRALIRNIYQRHAIRFDWQRNDLLLLDNMLYSHGCDSFVGDWQVLVGMARSIDADSVESLP